MLCHDEDECSIGAHICDANAECLNLDGTYTCTCSVGFDGNGEECNDIDECKGKLHFDNYLLCKTSTFGANDLNAYQLNRLSLGPLSVSQYLSNL